MNIEILLLVLESVLLVVTIILLLYSIKEGKHRDALLTEVGKATRILTREEYFLTISDSMMDAQSEVIGSITGRLPAGEDEKRVRAITGHIKQLRSKGGSARYVVPKFPDRLNVGHVYTRAGAEVRYSSSLMVQDVRYIVVDHKLVVMGIPEHVGDREATRKGYRIPSEGLAAMLADNFSKYWQAGTTYDAYVREVMKETGASPKLLARELHIDEAELERLGKQ